MNVKVIDTVHTNTRSNSISFNNNGITLVALVITIIVLLILAGISISMLMGDDGIIAKAIKAKEETEIAEQKDIIGRAAAQVKLNSNNNILTIDGLRNELSNYDAEVYDDIGSIIIKFENRYYEITENGEINETEVSEPKDVILQCVDSQGNILFEKNFILMRNNFSMSVPQIEGYEASNEIIEKTVTESTTIKHLYYKIFNDDTTIVFTGLDVSGNVTNIESEIVSYIVGDNTSNEGNGLKEKIIKGILIIPDTYKDKPVEKVGIDAFKKAQNIIKVDCGDNVQRISSTAFRYCKSLKEIRIGKACSNIDANTFGDCVNLEKMIFDSEIPSINISNSFNACGKFVEIEVNADNPIYKAENNVLYSKDGQILYMFPTGKEGEFIIPDGVNIINYLACGYKSNLNKVLISDSVTQCLGQSFDSSGKLEEVVIGKNVAVIGQFSFRRCNKLKTVVIKSQEIAKKITEQTSCGELVNVAITIYISNDITNIGSYIQENYSIQESDRDGYIKYVKK